MIVKRLRQKKDWSQDQLARMTGLSTRTIQRIESGSPASKESLKALASVFEVDISTLQEEITMIDKTTKAWENEPIWAKLAMWGIKYKKEVIAVELIGLLFGIWSMYTQNVYNAALGFLYAYVLSNLRHYIESKGHW